VNQKKINELLPHIKNNNLSISKEVIIIARIKRTIITGPPLSKKSNRDVKGRVK